MTEAAFHEMAAKIKIEMPDCTEVRVAPGRIKWEGQPCREILGIRVVEDRRFPPGATLWTTARLPVIEE